MTLLPTTGKYLIHRELNFASSFENWPMYNSVFSDVAFKLTPSNRLFHFDDDGHFILDQPLDFEDTPVHRLSVKAFNPRGNPSDLTTTMDMTIRVSNINEAPVFSKYVPPSNPIPENDETVIGQDGGRVKFTDPDGTRSFQFYIEDAAGFFDIDQTGYIKPIATIDREYGCINRVDGYRPGYHLVHVWVEDVCPDDVSNCSIKQSEQVPVYVSITFLIQPIYWQKLNVFIRFQSTMKMIIKHLLISWKLNLKDFVKMKISSIQ